MLKSLLNINLAIILMSTSLLDAQASSCYEENQELTKLGFIHDNNLLIKEEPNAYRHIEERKMSIIFPNQRKEKTISSLISGISLMTVTKMMG